MQLVDSARKFTYLLILSTGSHFFVVLSIPIFIAHDVEHNAEFSSVSSVNISRATDASPEKAGVGGSIPSLATTF
jgi:hypothetical protein